MGKIVMSDRKKRFFDVHTLIMNALAEGKDILVLKDIPDYMISWLRSVSYDIKIKSTGINRNTVTLLIQCTNGICDFKSTHKHIPNHGKDDPRYIKLKIREWIPNYEPITVEGYEKEFEDAQRCIKYAALNKLHFLVLADVPTCMLKWLDGMCSEGMDVLDMSANMHTVVMWFLSATECYRKDVLKCIEDGEFTQASYSIRLATCSNKELLKCIKLINEITQMKTEKTDYSLNALVISAEEAKERYETAKTGLVPHVKRVGELIKARCDTGLNVLTLQEAPDGLVEFLRDRGYNIEKINNFNTYKISW